MSISLLPSTSIIAHADLPGGYRLLRVQSPAWIKQCQPGMLLHTARGICCYLRHHDLDDKVDFLTLYAAQATWQTGDVVEQASVDTRFISATSPTAGPIIYQISAAYLGAGLSIALAGQFVAKQTLFLFELAQASPYPLQPSHFYLPYMPAAVIANMSLLEDRGVVGRFASQIGLPGCFEGSVAALCASVQERWPATVRLI